MAPFLNFQISDLRRLSSHHYLPNRDMSPIGECPSHDETEENDRKGLGMNGDRMNDSIVTEALLRMTGKGLCINYVTQRGEGGTEPESRVGSAFTTQSQFKLSSGSNPDGSTQNIQGI